VFAKLCDMQFRRLANAAMGVSGMAPVLKWINHRQRPGAGDC
jgi:hypothetical protein